MPRDQRGNDLGIGGGAESHTLFRELVVELDGVYQIAVVRQGDRATIVAVNRLGVVSRAAPGGGVANVANRDVSRERLEAPLVEHL